MELSETTTAAPLSVDALLEQAVGMGASDLHLTVGVEPAVRRRGHIELLREFPVLDPDMMRQLIYRITTTEQQKNLELGRQLDFAYGIRGLARFRVNTYYQRGSLAAAFRTIPATIKSLEELGLPESLHELAKNPRGLVLVTGPTGSGKSTTLASIIDEINRSRTDHIITIEDPIEFLHDHKRCIVNQREIGEDAKGFADALRGALHQDPDVILLGEMRDLETIQTALTAAETGHLVFGTLHTQSAPSPRTGSYSRSSRWCWCCWRSIGHRDRFVRRAGMGRNYGDRLFRVALSPRPNYPWAGRHGIEPNNHLR